PSRSTSRQPTLSRLIIPRSQRSTLFPYTTLFRSSAKLNLDSTSVPIAYVWPFQVMLCCSTLSPRRLSSKYSTSNRQRSEKRHRRSEEHTSELQSRENLVCGLLLEKKKEQSVAPSQ